MNAYTAILSARFRMLLQYRAAAFAGIVTQIFWGFIRVMIFEAFYRSTTAPQPMKLEDVITYVWLGQALLGLLPWNTDLEIRNMVKTGTVAYEMLRPVDLYNLWFFRALASRTAPTLLRAIPVFTLGLLFFGMRFPDSISSGFAWVLAMIGAIILGCSISTLLNISLLWTISGEGINRLLPAAVTIFSGMIIPIPLFPDWAQKILLALPFAGLVDMPFRIYVGNIPPNEIFLVLAHQLLWAAVFIAIGKAMVSRGVKIMTVQGG